MKITLKLFASLAVHLPVEARARHSVELDVEPGATVADLILRQGIPPTKCAIVRPHFVIAISSPRHARST